MSIGSTYARLTATGQTPIIKCGEGDGKTPFIEGRTVTACISPSQDWTGSDEKWETSVDGTAFTDLMVAAEIALITPGQVYKKDVTCGYAMRGSATATAGSIAFWLEGGI